MMQTLPFYKKLLIVFLTLLPLLFVCQDIYQHGKNVPFWDQWSSSANVALKTANHQLTVQDITRQHFEHRIIFTNLLTAFFTYTTRWNVHYEMIISPLLAIINLFLLYRLYQFDHPETAPFMLILLSALVFSLRQRENWLWGFQNQWHFVILFFLIGLSILQRTEVHWKAALGIGFCGVCAAFSFGAGLLFFPIMGLMLWIYGYRQKKYLIFWMVLSGCVFILYFFGYDRVGNTQQPNLLKATQFFLAYLGSPFIYRTPLLFLAVFFGGLGMLMVVLNGLFLHTIGHRFKNMSVWLALAMFSVGGGLMATPNRLANGMQASLASRYTTLSTLFWIAVFALAVPTIVHIANHANKKNGRERWLVNFNMLIFSLILGCYLMENYQIWQAEPLVTDASEMCYRVAIITQEYDCLAEINLSIDPSYDGTASREEVLTVLEQLAAEKLTLFAE